MQVRAVMLAQLAASLVLGVASPLRAAEPPPVDLELLEFLGEIDVSGEDWVALAEAESVERPAEVVPVTSVKEKDDGKQ